jgi:hypothetical protein
MLPGILDASTEHPLVLRHCLYAFCLGVAALWGQEAAPSSFELGFQERIRTESWDNLVDHRDATPDLRSQIRFRTRLWAIVPLTPDLTFTGGLVNENRKILHPDQAVNGREIAFEAFYLDWRVSPTWSLRAGRQNLMRGDGFVLWDGSALDGSRSAYVNALDAAWSSAGTTLELIALSDPSKDRYLPRINEAASPRERQLLNERDESALLVYATWRQPGRDLQAYAIHKTERHDLRALTDPLYQPDRRVEALGLRLAQDLTPGLRSTTEGTLQWGREDGRPGVAQASAAIRAWGAQARLEQTFDQPGKPLLAVGWVGLSGDDPRTSAREGWDPLFSRWPRWSELYVYSQVPEGGVGYWSNLRMWEATCQAQPWAKLGLRASAYWMRADQPVQDLGPIFAAGRGRGRLLEFRADLTLSKQWQGHVLYERLDPGTFYAGSDSGRFFRVEALYTFRRRR